MCPASKTGNFLMVSVILFLIYPSLQCAFFNPLSYLFPCAKTQPIQAEPIKFKVSKKRLKEINELIGNNPDIRVKSGNSNIPFTVAPSGLIRQSNNGFSTLPVEDYGTTAQLPEEIMLNGQKHYKTTRGALLLNRGFSALASAIPINAVQRIPKLLTNNNNNNNNPKKNEKEEKDNESEYEYEYEYEDDDDEDDDDNGKKVSKDKNSPKLSRKKGVSDTGDNGGKKKTENKKQNKNRSNENESEYEYEDEDDDDEDDDDDDGKKGNYDKGNRKKVKKGESSQELNRNKRVSDTGDNRGKKKTENKKQDKNRSSKNGLEENDSEYDSFQDE